MTDKSNIQRGWEFAASLVCADNAANEGNTYTCKIEKAIEMMGNSTNTHPYRRQDIPHFQGYVQEVFHAGTFNIDAIASGSLDRAKVLNSNKKGSVDISLLSGKNYSAKSYADGSKSAIAQAVIDKKTGEPLYKGQGRLIPCDQLEDAHAEAQRRMLKESLSRKSVSDAFKETDRELTDHLSNKEGIESTPASRKQLENMARAGQKGEFNAKEVGVTLDSVIHDDYVFRQSLKAGYTAATITIAVQLAPEIYKSIDYLIKNKEINIDQLKHTGKIAISASVDGFLRGFVSYELYIMCRRGMLGKHLETIDPTLLGAVVTIVLQAIKDSILVAAGKMTKHEMADAFADYAFVTGGYLIGTKLGGTIVQTLTWQFPVLGYLLGSLIGTSFAVLYKIGKNKFISLCCDTGVTCFGLVDQDYTLSDELLNEIGIDTIPITKTDIEQAEIVCTQTSYEIDKIEYETINITILRRGIISVNKIGYLPAI